MNWRYRLADHEKIEDGKSDEIDIIDNKYFWLKPFFSKAHLRYRISLFPDA